MQALFPFGRIAGRDDVVDREAYIEQMFVRLQMGQSAVMAGPRRIGKSSVATEVMRRLSEAGVYTATVDLFAASSIDEWAAQLTTAVLANKTGPLRLATRSLEALRKLVASAEVKTKIGDVELGFNWQATQKTENVLCALSLAESIAQTDGRRFVILMDEFQDVERLGGTEFIKQFRAVAQRQEHTSYLFLGSQPSLMKSLFADRRRALYRFATFSPLPKVPDDAWETYIADKLQERDMKVTDAALQGILRLTGGHPYGVMGLVSSAYLLAATAGLNRVDADMVAAADDMLMDHLGGIYDEQWLDIRRIKGADHVCLAIARQQPPYGALSSRSTVNRALRHLLDLGIVEKVSERGGYVLVEPMFGRWIQGRFA